MLNTGGSSGGLGVIAGWYSASRVYGTTAIKIPHNNGCLLSPPIRSFNKVRMLSSLVLPWWGLVAKSTTTATAQ